MKLKKKKTSSKKSEALKTQVDVLAAAFKESAEKQRKAKKEYDSSRDGILELIDNCSETLDTESGKELAGNKWRMGYTVSNPTPTIDGEKLNALLTVKERKKVITVSTVYSVDERALVELMQQGRFTKEQQATFISQREGAKSSYVKEV